MVVEVSSGIVEEIAGQSRAAHPREACGLLLGRPGAVEIAVTCNNVHSHPETHFEIDPQSLIDAHRAARMGGLQIIGYWHSHPSGRPDPSATDRKNATGDGKVWAIFGEGKVGWWLDGPGGFEALPTRVPCG